MPGFCRIFNKSGHGRASFRMTSKPGVSSCLDNIPAHGYELEKIEKEINTLRKSRNEVQQTTSRALPACNFRQSERAKTKSYSTTNCSLESRPLLKLQQ